MSGLRKRWLTAALAALALVLAACEAGEDDTGVEGDAAENDAGTEDEADEDDAADDDEAADDEAAEDGAEEDLQPAEGDTIMDALREREAADAGDDDGDDSEEAAEEEEEAEESEEGEEDSAPSYDTLVSAIEDAELAETLESEGPYTLLAPTDAAFEILPEDSLEDLTSDTERLERALRFHIIEDEIAAGDLSDGDTLETLAGEEISVRETQGGDMTIDGVELVEPDIEADNGVAHGISSILLPPPESE